MAVPLMEVGRQHPSRETDPSHGGTWDPYEDAMLPKAPLSLEWRQATCKRNLQLRTFGLTVVLWRMSETAQESPHLAFGHPLHLWRGTFAERGAYDRLLVVQRLDHVDPRGAVGGDD